MGRRSRSTEHVHAALRFGARAQGRAPAVAFRLPAVQGLVRRGDVPRSGPPSWNRGRRSRPLRGGLRPAKGGGGLVRGAGITGPRRWRQIRAPLMRTTLLLLPLLAALVGTGCLRPPQPILL